ncbi:sugar ABC transporter permease (plasmid) [Haloterrigena salifodinae]|uniref:Sugar ABC transporter permease n=1 Tax=Haloterrigena salifodinae TaxID=2675099 RepID=A0A8T8E7R6_9EURY|nr:sugar ABC transporter permease [Haloterrigena salifodinae]QRV17401.1 sugar ABC transporter permease [Haloterrigena salifodinae]
MSTESPESTVQSSADEHSQSYLSALRSWVGLTKDQNNLVGMLFVLPNVIVFSGFMLLPVLYAFYLSFMEWNLFLGEGTYVGLENYVTILTPLPWENNWAALRSPTANLWWFSLRNTVIYTVGVIPLQVFGGLGVAMLLNKSIRGKGIYRAAYFMPVMLSGAASAVIWRWLFATDGVINDLLRPLGLAHNWATDPVTALPSLMVIAIWGGIGFNMILYLAGLQNVPEELYEAARLDGATRWYRFRHVTWPCLRNTTFFVLVMAIIGAFQVFGIALAFAGGGPYYATTTVVVLIYERAFNQGAFGEAAAMSFLLFLIIFVFSYLQYKHFGANEVDY